MCVCVCVSVWLRSSSSGCAAANPAAQQQQRLLRGRCKSLRTHFMCVGVYVWVHMRVSLSVYMCLSVCVGIRGGTNEPVGAPPLQFSFLMKTAD